MSMTPGLLVLLRVSVCHLDRPASAFE